APSLFGVIGQETPAFKEGRAAVQYSVEALAALVGGTVEGDDQTQVSGARPITHAGPGDITFIEDARYAKQLEQSHVSAAVVGPAFHTTIKIPVIRVS